MKHLSLDDGRTITLREMTGDYIIPGGSGRCAVNTRMVVGSDVVPTEEYRALSEVLAEYYGTSVLYALDDENQVIGFVSFYPTWCPHFDICSNEQITEALAELEAIKNPPECDDPALHVRCLVIRHEYQGHGIALELLNYLKEWAKDHGWKKIVGNGGIFSGLAQYQWLIAPKPPVPFWEMAGFEVAAFPPLELPAISDLEQTRGARDWYNSPGFPKHVPRDIDPHDPNWREIFADYTVVCEL